MKHLVLATLTTLTLAAVSTTASAQYFEPRNPEEGGYYTPSEQEYHRYRAAEQQYRSPGSGGKDTSSGTFFGIAIDLGGSFGQASDVDDELFEPNGASPLSTVPMVSLEGSAFFQLASFLRLGATMGADGGVRDEAAASQFRFGGMAEVGFWSPTGVGVFAGGGAGFGAFAAESEDRDLGIYEYTASGLWVRGAVRIEKAISENIGIRFSGTYDRLFVRDDEVTISVLDQPGIPDPVLGEPNGDINTFGFRAGIVVLF